MKRQLFILTMGTWTTSDQAVHVEIAAIPEMVRVERGSFQMGSYVSEAEEPVHKVTIDTYYIGKYPVTVQQYRAFCTATGRVMPPESYADWDYSGYAPIVNVTYDDAMHYCEWLGVNYGDNWRLPTEAEWEYAARGGRQSKGYIYSGSDNLSTVGWFGGNSRGSAIGIGRKRANELGIYDMSGNVWEWCRDWYGADYYTHRPVSNPQGPTSGTQRVLRGGAWDEIPIACRVAHRGHRMPEERCVNCGFRVVRHPLLARGG